MFRHCSTLVLLRPFSREATPSRVCEKRRGGASKPHPTHESFPFPLCSPSPATAAAEAAVTAVAFLSARGRVTHEGREGKGGEGEGGREDGIA